MALVKKSFKYLLSLGLMLLFFYWAFADIDPSELWHTTRALPPIWIGAIALTTMVTLGLRAWRWVVLIRPFAPQISVADATSALGICYAANIFIPRSGEALRALNLKWKRDASLGALLGTVLVERLIDMMWLITFVGLALLLARGRIIANYPLLESISVIAMVGCLMLLTGFALLSIFQHRAVPLIRRQLERVSPRLSNFTIKLLQTFLAGFTALQSPAAYGKLVLSSALLNLGYMLIIYEAFLGFGLVQDFGLGFGDALVTMAISSLGMLFPTIGGGAGTYHFFFRDALHLIYAVPLTPALACATAVHAIATTVYLSFGLPILFLQWRARKRQKDMEPKTPSPAPTPVSH